MKLPYSVQHWNKTPVDTERKNSQNYKSIAKTTARSRKYSPPDVSAYQTAQITSNPRKWYKNNHNTRKILPVYTQEIDPKINSKRIKAELLKFQIELKQDSRSANHQHLQANMTSKQTFYDANHPYLMKVALIKENRRKSSTTSNHKSSITKKTYQIKTPELVPIFAAR